MLEIRDVSRYYGAKCALSRVCLTLGPGEIVGLLGENGAGKSTLMKCVFGFIRHTGRVTLDGEAITARNIARLSFATCEHSFIPSLSAAAHREFYREQFPTFQEKRFDVLMDFFGLPRLRAAGRLSVGQQNQLETVLALSQGADYIFMDEPFAGSDLFNREDFYKVLAGILTERETVVLSTHLIEEVSGFLGRAVLLHAGRIVGDLTTDALDARGMTLTEAVKETYRYRSDRVRDAIDALSDGEERP